MLTVFSRSYCMDRLYWYDNVVCDFTI